MATVAAPVLAPAIPTVDMPTAIQAASAVTPIVEKPIAPEAVSDVPRKGEAPLTPVPSVPEAKVVSEASSNSEIKPSPDAALTPATISASEIVPAAEASRVLEGAPVADLASTAKMQENFVALREPPEPRGPNPTRPIRSPGHPTPPAPKPALPTVPDGPWASPYFVGGDGGSDFAWVPHNYSLVQKIGLWKNPSLTGIKIVQFDGQSAEYGGKRGDYHEYTFATGEKITELQIFGNGIGTRCGRVVFKTDKGGLFDWGQNTSGQTAYVPDTGSGLLVGVAGRAGDEIDLFAMYFLGAIQTITVTDMKYAIDPRNTDTGIQPGYSFQESYPWNGVPYDFIFSGNKVKKSTSTWSSSTTNNFGLEATFKATLIPEIVEVSGKFAWSIAKADVQGGQTEDDTQLNWSVARSVKVPGDNFECTAVAWTGTLDIPYTSNVSVNLKDGRKWVYQDKGTFQNVQWSKVNSQVIRVPAGQLGPTGERAWKAGKWVRV